MMKSILVTVDFSEVSRRVIEQAARLAQSSRARLVLLHVAPPEPEFIGYDAGPQTVRDDMARDFRETHRILQALAEEQRQAGIDASAVMLRGTTIDTILEEAQKVEADLIVMGSHGRRALLRVLMGSTSEGVLRRSDRPVLIVPSRGEPKEV